MLRLLYLRLGAWPLRDVCLALLAGGLLAATAVSLFGSPDRRPPVVNSEFALPELPKLPAAPPHSSEDALMQAARSRLFGSIDALDAHAVTEPAAVAAAEPNRSHLSALRLQGIAVRGGLALALIADVRNGSRASVYRAGDSIAGYRLETVHADSVVLVGPDTTAVLRIERPWERREP